MSENLKLTKISDLPESTRTDLTYFFGYEPDNPVNKSVKIPFSSIAKASNERRIAIVMETDEMIIPVGERMVIYRVSGKNLSKLSIKPDNSADGYAAIPLDTDVSVDIANCLATDARIRIERKSIDSICTVYIFVKVIQD